MKKHLFRDSDILRAISLLTAAFFLHNQVAVFAQIPQNEMAEFSQPALQKSAAENFQPAEQSSSINTSGLTTDFLQSELRLEAVELGNKPVEKKSLFELEEKLEEKIEAPSEPSTFERALDIINNAKGFAAAVVDKISQSHLAELAGQVWEYGVAIVRGIIVLFTSHDENRLEVTSGFREILDNEADFLLHKQSEDELDPSRTDYLGAEIRGREEYLIARDEAGLGAARFNGSGRSERIGAAEVENEIDELRDVSYLSLVSVRDLIQKENTENRNLLELYRSDPPAEIDPDPSNPAVTPLADTSLNTSPFLKGRARSSTPDGGVDYSNVAVNTESHTQAEVEFNLYNTFSWGLAELDYDDAATSGAETFNFNTAFPDGMVLGLSSSSLNSVILELTDANNQNSRVILKNITSSAQKWKVLGNQFSGIDLTKISKITLGLEGVRITEAVLNIEWENIGYIPRLTFDPSNPAITTLPVLDNGEKPQAGARASKTNSDGSPDYSAADVVLASQSEGTVTLNLYNTTSSGEIFVSYDDPATGSAESIDLDSLFSSGLVLEVASTDLPEIYLQVRDTDGQVDRVLLTGVAESGKRFKIPPSLFDDVDTAKITEISLGAAGRYVGKTFNYKWGNFAFTPEVAPAGGNPAVTPLPSNGQGARPVLTAYASKTNPDGSTDYSSAGVTLNSTSSASVALNQYNTTSSSGVFVSYDNPSTEGTVESINLNSVFPDGIVLSLDSPELAGVYLIVTDVLGKKASVLLKSLSSTPQKYEIDTALFDGVDLSQITRLALESRGREVNRHLNVQWGNFNYLPEVSYAETEPDLYELPLNSLGKKPVFISSASSSTPEGGIDYSQTGVDLKAPSAGKISFNQYNTFSWGRAGFDYDDPATSGTIEAVDLTQAFPEGMAFALSNNETGLSEILFEVIDASGARDTVKIKNISELYRAYNLQTSLFDEVDLTHVVSFGFYLDGRHVAQNLSVYWGSFAYATAVSGSAYDETVLTQLSGEPEVTAQVRAASATLDVQVNSSSEFDFVFDLRNSVSAEGAAVVSAGDFDNFGVFQGTHLNLPSSLILAARGTEDGRLRVEVTDINKRTAVFILNLRPVYQNYELNLTGDFVPPGFNHSQIASISFAEDLLAENPLENDLVKVKLPGLHYEEPSFSSEEQAVKDMLITKGLTFFTQDHAIDPVTHFPYDSVEADGQPVIDADDSKDTRFTQPTLIGFYLQILGEVVSGTLDNGMTRDEALAEINTVLTNLLTVQADFGWKGLLPWMKLAPSVYPRTLDVALGDNANLSQSLAIVSGLLDMSQLTAAQQSLAESLKEKVEVFLDNQAEGYQSFVEEVSGGFYQVFRRDDYTASTGSFPASYMDRVANEFRGAIAFLVARYPSIPETVFQALSLKYSTYTDSSGNLIKNLAYFDGGAFQAFWPLLRNRETDFIGFHKALNNAFVTFTDYSARNHIPGFVSASQRPDGTEPGYYEGRTGIRDIAEAGFGVSADEFIGDVGSIYALAAAYSLDPEIVLQWMASIRSQIPELEGGQGLFDSARSASEISKRFLGIDVASTILGLTDAGPAAFETYLRNKNIELAHNLLYDELSRSIAIENQTTVSPSSPVEFQDKSFAVFSHLAEQGKINSFTGPDTTPAGVHFNHGALKDGYGGYYWIFDENYDAQANQLVITYSSTNTPKNLKIELKDENGNLLIPEFFTPPLVNSAIDKKIVIQLPNNQSLSALRQVILINDQNVANDRSSNFIIHAFSFQHRPSFQEINPESDLEQGDVSTVSGAAPPVFFSSNGVGSLDRPSSREVRVNYNFSTEGYAGFSAGFSGTGLNLQSLGKLVFGVSSSNAKKLKVEFEDNNGNRAVYYATGVDVGKNYYEFLSSSLQGSIDATKVKKIYFSVNEELFDSSPSSGNFILELLGIPS